MVNINIKATHTTLTESMGDYLAKKLKVLDKFLHDENKLHVELDAEPQHHKGPRFKAEITVLPGRETYAEAWGSDLYEAIDLCIPKIREQLAKQKDKHISKVRREQRRKRM